MTDRDAVLRANREFYRAFRERDGTGMRHVWALEHPVACTHPGWEPLEGRRAVLESFDAIMASSGSPPVRPDDEAVLELGDAAVVVCAELIDEVRLIATNVFVREAGQWRLVMHQASPLSRRRPAPPPTQLN